MRFLVNVIAILVAMNAVTSSSTTNISRSAKSHLKTLCAPLENAHPACVGGIRFSDDGLHVVSMSIDRVLRIWRAHTMELVNTIKVGSEWLLAQ